MHHVAIGTVSTLLAAALLSGCSGEPEVKEPDPSPSSSRATPDVAPPSLSPAAREDTPSGAANFAIYWTAVSDYAAVTGDVTELRRISDPECKSCRTFIDLYEEVHADGGYYTGGKQTLNDITVDPVDDAPQKIVLVRATSSMAAGVVRNSSTSKEVATEPETSRLIFRVARVGDEWVLMAHAVEK